MRALYSWLLRLLFPWVLLRLFVRGVRNPDYWRRIPERFGFVPRLTGAPVIWIHAVSVGEARACVPLVRRLFERFPGHRLLITTMTPTGSATVRSALGNGVAHCYVPYDYPSAVSRFLDRARPALAIVMETELWPNLFHACRARNVPLVVANVRLSGRSATRYAKFSRLVSRTLQQVSRFGVQHQADADRLIALGAVREHVSVTGSIKFELNLPASLMESAEVLRREWGADRPVWLAASTHDGEDEFVLSAHTELRRRARLTNALLVLVPRHPERFNAVARLCRRLGFNAALRSETRERALPDETAVLVGDTMGELPLFYAAVDAAFIGGSLVPTGGHNLLEASAVGRPVVFGPHMFNFTEIAQMTLERHAGVQIHDATGLGAVVAALLTDPNRRDRLGEAGRKMVEENRGALERTLALIEGCCLTGRE